MFHLWKTGPMLRLLHLSTPSFAGWVACLICQTPSFWLVASPFFMAFVCMFFSEGVVLVLPVIVTQPAWNPNVPAPCSWVLSPGMHFVHAPIEVFFSKLSQSVLGYFDSVNMFFFIIKINNLRGELSDISSKSATLDATSVTTKRYGKGETMQRNQSE